MSLFDNGHAIQHPIKPFEGPARPDLVRNANEARDPDAPNFREILSDSVQQVNVRQQQADKAIEDLATGKTENLAAVMTAVEKADIAFRTLMQFRNKLVDAYQEINNMRY